MKDNIITWANKEPGIRALILSGSRANGFAVDELSDYDISVFCESVVPYIENDLWLSQIGIVWVCVPETVHCNDQVFPTRLVIFEGGIKVDFSFFPKNILQELKDCKSLYDDYSRGYRVLLDKDGMAQKLPKLHLSAPKKPSEREFQSVIKEFWFESYHVAKYLKRKDLWLVKFRAGGVNEFLLKMIEWHAQIQQDLSAPPHGKLMQSWVDAETWKEIHNIFAHFDEEDSWVAFEFTMTLFRRLAKATASAWHFQYLHDVDKNIYQFIDSLRPSRKQMMNADLVPASLSDYPLIQNMARFYVYDMSEYMSDDEVWKIPADGLFECIDFKKYWDDETAQPFLIHVGGEIAGFVIIDKKGSDEKVDYNMAQFFILRRFKGRGLGNQVACQCFDRFKGTWEVMVMPKNLGAYQFWKRIITEYSTNQHLEYTRTVKHLDNASKNIFRFTSR